PDHRPEAPRAQRPGAGALRRAAALGRGLARVAPRADLAVPGPCSRAAADRRPRRVGAGRRSPGAELVRHLPRPRTALELVGPRGAPCVDRRPDRHRSAAPTEPSAPDRPDGAAHVVPADELPRAVLVRAPERDRARVTARQESLVRAAGERQHGGQARPGAFAALDADRPTVRLYAVPEAEQAGPPSGICAADTVAGDGDTKGAVAQVDLDLHSGRARVLGGVRQRL